MKAKDIKPGVVYAHQRGRGAYASFTAVVVLAPADSSHVYSTASLHRPEGSPAFVKARPGIKPGRGKGWGSVDHGYPAVMGPVDKVTGFTLADFDAATSAYVGDGVRFEVLPSLVQIVGPYEEAVAAQERLRLEDSERRKREQAARKADVAKGRALVAALADAGIQADTDRDWHPRAVTIPLEEAEKLVALLGGDAQEVPDAEDFARWVVSLDDPDGPGYEARRKVTLGQIIDRARKALGDAQEGPDA